MTDIEIEPERRRLCPSCGMPAVDGASFCGECGHSLVETPTGPAGLDAGQTEIESAAVANLPSAEPPGHELPPPGIIPSEAGSAPKATKEKSRKRWILRRLVGAIVAPFSRSRASQSDSQSSSGNMGTTGTRAGTSTPQFGSVVSRWLSRRSGVRRPLGFHRSDGHPPSGATAPERMSKMETMEEKKPRPRRSFTPEFKPEIVELCRRGDRSIGQVATELRSDRDQRAHLVEFVVLLALSTRR